MTDDQFLGEHRSDVTVHELRLTSTLDGYTGPR
jgi:hypothetical protein